MTMEKTNNGVFFAREPLVKMDARNLQFLKQKVGETERKQVRICTHLNLEDKLQEMFLLQARETYIRPHKHASRSKSIHAIEGRADILVFSEDGRLVDVIPMGDYTSGQLFYCRIREPLYHSPLVRSDYWIFKESTTGPFDESGTLFAPWAPDVTDVQAGKKFLETQRKAAAEFLGEK